MQLCKSQTSVLISKRRVLSVNDKVQIIREIESGQKISVLARKYGLSSSTISTLLKNKETLLNAFERNITQSKRLKKPGKPDLDDLLFKWFLYQQNCGLPTSGPILKSQAEEFAYQLGYNKFSCTNGWLHRFKMRHNIYFKKENGKLGMDNNNKVLALPETGPLLPMLENISDNLVCGMTEKVEETVVRDKNLEMNDKDRNVCDKNIEIEEEKSNSIKEICDDVVALSNKNVSKEVIDTSKFIETVWLSPNETNINNDNEKSRSKFSQTTQIRKQNPSSFLNAATGCVDILQHYFEATDNCDQEVSNAIDVIRKKLKVHTEKNKTTLRQPTIDKFVRPL